MPDRTRAEIDLLRQGADAVIAVIARTHFVGLVEGMMAERDRLFPYPTTPRTFTRSDGVKYRVTGERWEYLLKRSDVWFAVGGWPASLDAADARGLLDLWDHPNEAEGK